MRNLHTSGNYDGHVEYENVSFQNKFQSVNFYILGVISSGSTASFINILIMPIIQQQAITSKTFGTA